MAVFAIADLHLSHVDEKSMDIFGRHWKGHWDKIQQAWRSRIGAEDLVLIPGEDVYKSQISLCTFSLACSLSCTLSALARNASISLAESSSPSSVWMAFICSRR